MAQCLEEGDFPGSGRSMGWHCAIRTHQVSLSLTFPIVQLESQPFTGCRVSCAQSLQRAAEMLAPRLEDQQMVSLKRA